MCARVFLRILSHNRQVSMRQELVFGVDVFDLDFGVQINSIEQPIKSNSVGS